MPVRNLFIGLPAFNEEIALPRLLGKIAGLREASGLEITTLVYNDGSTDRTAEIARDWQARMPLVLLGTAANGGLGAGLRALVRHACDNGAPDDVLVVMDCDDSHDPSQIPQIIARLESGDDLVIASRFRRGASAVRVPALRHVTAYGAMILFKTHSPVAQRARLYLRLSCLPGRPAAARIAGVWTIAGVGARVLLHGGTAVEAQPPEAAHLGSAADAALRPEAHRQQGRAGTLYHPLAVVNGKMAGEGIRVSWAIADAHRKLTRPSAES